VFSGFIEVGGYSESELYHVSYLGLAASLRDKQVIDDTDIFLGIQLPALLNATGSVQTTPTNYTFLNGDAPTILGRFAFGTPSLNIDLVDKDTEFYPTISSRDSEAWPGLVTFPSFRKGGSFAEVKTIGSIAGFQYIPRNSDVVGSQPSENSDSLQISPTFANGTNIPNGDYRILMRALRVTGNPANEDDYESWLSPIFGVRVPSEP